MFNPFTLHLQFTLFGVVVTRFDISVSLYTVKGIDLTICNSFCHTEAEYIRRATKMRILTASMYYVVAKVQGYTLLDVDMLPLQGEHWQTDQMVSAYLSLVASRFSRPGKLVLALDFTVVGSIFTGVGIKRHLEQDAQLPLSSVSVLK